MCLENGEAERAARSREALSLSAGATAGGRRPTWQGLRRRRGAAESRRRDDVVRFRGRVRMAGADGVGHAERHRYGERQGEAQTPLGWSYWHTFPHCPTIAPERGFVAPFRDFRSATRGEPPRYIQRCERRRVLPDQHLVSHQRPPRHRQPDPGLGVVAVNLWYDVGSRHEQPASARLRAPLRAPDVPGLATRQVR